MCGLCGYYQSDIWMLYPRTGIGLVYSHSGIFIRYSRSGIRMRVGNAKEIGRLIRQARSDRGMTQSALAKVCGTTQSWLSELESGKPRAELDLVLRIMRELEFSLEMSSASRHGSAGEPAHGFDVADLVDMPTPNTNTQRGGGQSGNDDC